MPESCASQAYLTSCDTPTSPRCPPCPGTEPLTREDFELVGMTLATSATIATKRECPPCPATEPITREDIDGLQLDDYIQPTLEQQEKKRRKITSRECNGVPYLPIITISVDRVRDECPPQGGVKPIELQ